MAKNETVRLYNRSSQMIGIQLRPPGGDFYLSEQCLYLRSKQTVKVPKSHLNKSQIDNLQRRRELQVVYDSSVASE